MIALVDGFNPRSLWVLSVLLALTLNTGSRRKLFWVGLTFLTVTALVYMAFITGIFTMLHVLPFVGWVRGIVALVMLVNPAWMSQISSSFLVFAVAFGVAGLVLLVHRNLLPRFGIRIGSELAPTVAGQRHHHKRRQR
jgi:hypothetical protein